MPIKRLRPGDGIRRCPVVALLLALIAGLAVAGHIQAARSGAWHFTADPGARLPSGVSPEVIRLSDGSLLAFVSDIGNMRVYRSTDGLAFTRVAAQPPPGGHDAAIVPLAEGGWRMYFDIQHDPSSGNEIDSATSRDGLNWTVEDGIRVGLGSNRISSVPEAVTLPDGRVRLYYVLGGSGRSLENIASATSSDGLAFAVDPGYRLMGGYVDPAVIQLPDGSWLMAVSRTPMEQQRIFLAHSTDGLSWTIDTKPVIALAQGANALDPTLLPLADGSIRVYFSTAASTDALSGPYRVLSGLLKQGAASPVVRHALVVRVKGHGSVKGGAISCPGVCRASLADGAKVTLTARPIRGYRLSAWGGACSGRKKTCAFTLHKDASVRATFTESD
jgi:hypothetical protein